MKKEIRKDVFGVIPEIGDLIAFNPPKHKGLIVSECKGFSLSGLPEVEFIEGMRGSYNLSGYYSPKTGFIVHKINK